MKNILPPPVDSNEIDRMKAAFNGYFRAIQTEDGVLVQKNTGRTAWFTIDETTAEHYLVGFGFRFREFLNRHRPDLLKNKIC